MIFEDSGSRKGALDHKMDELYEKTLLYDYYGELLTLHQREIYENVVFNDMSLSEAAEEYGISRQGVHDLIRRCNQALEEYESKLHMVEQSREIRKAAEEIEKTAKEGKAARDPEELKKLRDLARTI